MKKNKTVLSTAWIKKNVSEKEIQEAANEMKGNRAYLFMCDDGYLFMSCKRHLSEFEAKDKTFLRQVPVTKTPINNQ